MLTVSGAFDENLHFQLRREFDDTPIAVLAEHDIAIRPDRHSVGTNVAALWRILTIISAWV